jgi:hypothetical protein
MANVLSDEKRQQVVALGRLGWSLRRIERETGVRRETASAYLKAMGVEVRGHGGAKSKPATSAEVITDPPAPTRSPTVSTCEPYRELITRWVDDGRTGMSIWQELVEWHGFAARYASVGRFVRTLQGERSPEARVVIATRPGEVRAHPDALGLALTAA